MEQKDTPTMLSLTGQNPMTAKLSDHNPLINNGIISFNMMMQAKWNPAKKRYNNGFGIKEESQTQYQSRIKAAVLMLAEVAHLNPQVYAIGLVEAPIEAADIGVLIAEFAKYPSLKRFQKSLSPEIFSPMGIATLFDTERFDVTASAITFIPNCMQERIQKFILTHKKDSSQKFQVCNLHLPFDAAKAQNTEVLRNFIKQLTKGPLATIIMGDFNMAPVYKEIEDAVAFTPEKNNILALSDEGGTITGTKYESVDSIVYVHETELPHHPTAFFDCKRLFIGLNPQIKNEAEKTKNSFAFLDARITNTHELSFCASF